MRAAALALLLALPVQAAQVKIVALGDSTTAGTPFFKSPLEAPPEGEGDPQGQYAYWMMKSRPGWVVLNRGIDGQRADEIRARFAADVLSEKPKYVIILAGVNDAYQQRDIEEAKADLMWMYEQAALSAMTPIACTIPPFTKSLPAQARYIIDLNRWIRDTSDLLKLPLCDLSRATADKKDETRLRGSPDGLHPDIKGYRAMGEALVKVIDRLEKEDQK